MTQIDYMEHVNHDDEVTPVQMRHVLNMMDRRAARLPNHREVITEIALMLGAITEPNTVCGTLRGYRLHKARLDPPCDACERAHAADIATRTAGAR